MANTTFGSLETDERFKKLERSLKLALLKKEHGKSVHSNKVTHWPSISSINALDSSCVAPSQMSMVGSEVLASSNNLKNILSRRNMHNNKQEMISTSSVKEYNVKQDHTDQFVMPPPTGNIVYRTSKKPQKKIYVSSDCEKTESITSNNSTQSPTRNTFSLKSSSISTNTNIEKEYLNTFVRPTSLANDSQIIDRKFSRWRVMLNDKYELIIKGTLECGKVARSKPIIRRYTARCIESKFKHKYSLQGNIVDERNELPDYICGKFYNGFPDDWQNIYQIWRTYVSQGCPVTFRWPTTITDSDDDLKSELTDLTYVRNNSTTSAMKSYKNEYVKSENASIKESPKKCYNYSTCNFPTLNENDYSSAKSFISDAEKNATPIAQTNVKLTCEKVRENKRDIEINSACSPKRANKLQDILQEDKLKIIIDNLADKNCSPKYIDKIIEMFDCLNYVVSYRTDSEHKCDSVVSTSCEMSNSNAIPLQEIIVHNDDHVSSKNLENNGTMEIKSYMQSTDLGYASIRNDSNPSQLSNPKHFLQSKYDDNKDSDESESETYAGVPKISIERILKMREASRKTQASHKRKVRKKMIHLDTPNYTINPQYNTEELDFESVHTTVPITISEQKLLANESCVSITEDEIETVNTRKYQKTIIQDAQKMTFSNQRNCNIYEENKPITLVQKKQLLEPFETQRVNLNVFIKEQQVPHKVHENAHSQFIANVDSANSDIDVISINTNKQKEIQNRNMMKMHTNLDPDIVISSESNSNSIEKFRISRELHGEFIEPPKSKIPVKRAKPTIISSVPVNLNLKISSTESKSREPYNSDVSIIENEENQWTNIPPIEEARKKSIVKTSMAMKPAIIMSHCNSTVDNTKQNENHPKTSNRNELTNINSTNSPKPTMNSTIRQSRNSKLIASKNDSKVLTAWMPKVIYYAKSKSDLGLIFQGKLLNEVGHVINRKFMTNIVLKRLSATLIETVNHEFYQLLGHLNDTKHILPKELVRQCRNGCPAKIDQFCLTWKALLHDNVHILGAKSHDASIDSLSVPVSSRGRKILPPLCYWTGERVTLKDNNPIYNPGNSQESLTENMRKNNEAKKKQKVNSTSKKSGTNKQKMSPESNEISGANKNQIIEKTQSSNKSPKTTVMNNTKTANIKKSRISTINGKRQVAQQLTFSSSESSENEEETSPRKYARRSNKNTNTDALSRCTMALRKRQKVETFPNRISYDDAFKSKYDAAYTSPTKKSNYKTTYTYYKDISLAEDLLSENPASPKT